jgi:molybdate transport system substrate-binding protein
LHGNQLNTNAMKSIKILLAASLFLYSPAFSQNLKVAVAANLQAVIKILKSDFKSKTGITIEPIVGSSGHLTSQVKNGAHMMCFYLLI